MLKRKLLILGSSGFLGENLKKEFQESAEFSVILTSRSGGTKDTLFLDLLDEATWQPLEADVIINAIGYGVVKYETDLAKEYDVNYLRAIAYFEYQHKKNSSLLWIQIGTAFEYDLSAGSIDENTACIPKTAYGMSKWLMSNYFLQQRTNQNFIIIRPFAMFGPHEDSTKIIPALILSQLHQKELPLSIGTQKRDYSYVRDVTFFIHELISRYFNKEVIPEIINVGSGRALSLREIGNQLSAVLEIYDPRYWRWGEIALRENEAEYFYNGSDVGKSLGFKNREMQVALLETINYYRNVRI